MKTVGLFAGIGGIEYGLQQSGFNTSIFCEIMPEAQCVLSSHFANIPIYSDIRTLENIPDTEILAAGFPCQNISIAGNKTGIKGEQSSLVCEIFRLLHNNTLPKYVIIENVANLISLNGGEAISLITSTLKSMGYEWAYRLVDPRSFGIPQRRPRLILIASLEIHPQHILFPDDENIDATIDDRLNPNEENVKGYGFYWTEGKLGIGWAKDSIPPLKCGSTLGLPSSPAIWDIKHNFFGTPSIKDAERLQGFPSNWTSPIEDNGFRKNFRWKLIGNAVNTKVSEWVGKQMLSPNTKDVDKERLFVPNKKHWPKAAISLGDEVFGVKASCYPQGVSYTSIIDFLQDPLVPLSLRAILGFEKRMNESTIVQYPSIFRQSIKTYLRSQYGYIG